MDTRIRIEQVGVRDSACLDREAQFRSIRIDCGLELPLLGFVPHPGTVPRGAASVDRYPRVIHIGAQPDKAIAILQSFCWVRTNGSREFGAADGRAVIDLISGKLLEKDDNKLITGRRR